MEDLNLVYKGAHTNNYYTAYFDGTRWHGNTQIGTQPGGISPQSDHNPTVVTFNNWIYVIYKDAASTDLCCAWNDGLRWYGGVKIGTMNGGIQPQSNAAPNAAVYKGLLFITYLDPDSHEVYTSWFDGTTWYGNKKINDQTGGIDPESSYNPAICVYNGLLYIIYTGRYFSDLYTATFDGMVWTGNSKISDQPGGINPKSSYSPGATVYDGKLILGYLGSWSSSIYTATYDGTTWAGNTKIKDQSGGIDPSSNYNPAMDVFDGKLYLVYKGAHFSSLYSACFDGTTWTGNTQIGDQPGGISPSSNFNPGISVSATIPGSQPDWMSKLPDAIPLGDINVPGSHDAAAINSWISTPYACHNYSITEQLEYGIRLLDVRLKVSRDGSQYTFMTCHGHIWPNVYQSFPSLMDECKCFLATNEKEVILMSLKVDDPKNGAGVTSAAYTALKNLLAGYPIATSGDMPTLGSVRGKIFLLNRMNQDLALGVNLIVPDNTDGEVVPRAGNRSYSYFIQDRYEGLPLLYPSATKFPLVTAAFEQKQNQPMVFNFASATWYAAFGVYSTVLRLLLNYFGAKAATNRPAKFGWLLMNYPFNKYNTDTYGPLDVVTIIIASNFGYQGYEDEFQVVPDGKDEL